MDAGGGALLLVRPGGGRPRSRAGARGARADAIGLIALAGPDRQAALLQGLVEPREPEPVQVAAVGALGRVPGEAVGTFLLARWRALTPAVREEAAEALLRDPGRTKLLLAALKDGSVAAWTLSFWYKRDLLMHDDPAVRAEAPGLLEEKPGEREQGLKR